MDRVETVQRLLKVFRQHGYEGLLCHASQRQRFRGESLSSFPQREKEMAEAVLTYVNQWFKATVLEPLYSEGQPVERIQAMNTSLSSTRTRCLPASSVHLASLTIYFILKCNRH